MLHSECLSDKVCLREWLAEGEHNVNEQIFHVNGFLLLCSNKCEACQEALILSCGLKGQRVIAPGIEDLYGASLNYLALSMMKNILSVFYPAIMMKGI